MQHQPRISSLQSASPYDMELLLAIPGGYGKDPNFTDVLPIFVIAANGSGKGRISCSSSRRSRPSRSSNNKKK